MMAKVLPESLAGKESIIIIGMQYREPLKGSSQVVRICGGKIVFSCLEQINKTQLSHLISHNLGRAF